MKAESLIATFGIDLHSAEHNISANELVRMAPAVLYQHQNPQCKLVEPVDESEWWKSIQIIRIWWNYEEMKTFEFDLHVSHIIQEIGGK